MLVSGTCWDSKKDLCWKSLILPGGVTMENLLMFSEPQFSLQKSEVVM